MSHLEDRFAMLWRAIGGKPPEAQYVFPIPGAPKRGRPWAFDFAWPDEMLAVEIEGGSWSGGSHTKGIRFQSDCRKYNTATLLGWRILRYTTNDVQRRSAEMLDEIHAALHNRPLWTPEREES